MKKLVAWLVVGGGAVSSALSRLAIVLPVIAGLVVFIALFGLTLMALSKHFGVIFRVERTEHGGFTVGVVPRPPDP